MAREDCIHYESGIEGFCSRDLPPKCCGSSMLCPRYATKQPVTGTDCIHIQATDWMGNWRCVQGHFEAETSHPESCGQRCSDYATERPASKCIHNHERGLTCPKAEVMFPPKPYCGPDCPDYAVEQPATGAVHPFAYNPPPELPEKDCPNYNDCVQSIRTTDWRPIVTCGPDCKLFGIPMASFLRLAVEQEEKGGLDSYNSPPPDLQPPEKPPPARPWPRCVHGVLLGDCKWGCGYPYNREYDTTLKQISVQSSQPKQPRPFARVDGTIICLDDFTSFKIEEGSGYLIAILGMSLASNKWVTLCGYRVSDEPKAQTDLDTIQAAIEHWNQLAREPECTCDTPERNVRLKSITENIDFTETKRRMTKEFKEMGFDPDDTNNELGQPAPISFKAVWAALAGVMLLEKVDVP